MIRSVSGSLVLGKTRDTSRISVACAPSLREHSAVPRIARIIAAGYPHQIAQRGNSRATVFFGDENRQTYLNLLLNYSQKYGFAIWAYCLMRNHVHLLAVPETETGLARGTGLTNMLYTQ